MEKRQKIRTTVHVPVTVEFYDPLKDDFYNQSGIVVDTSSNGIRIETTKRLEQGLPVLIRADMTSDRFADGSSIGRTFHGEIKWCRNQNTLPGDYACFVGIRFYEPLKKNWC